MMFPHLTTQHLAIDGSWHEENQSLRFTGTIASSAPFVILSLLKHGERYHYMKHDKSDALEVAIDLYQSKFPHQNRYQPILTIGHPMQAGSEESFLPLVVPLSAKTLHNQKIVPNCKNAV